MMTILLEEGSQTDVGRLLLPIQKQAESLNWLIAEFHCWYSDREAPVIEEWEAAPRYSVAAGKTLVKAFAGREIQVIWGVFCGVLGSVPNLSDAEIPYANGNRSLWAEPESFQLPASEIEIICFDSSLTLVRFRDNTLGQRFLQVFPDGRIVANPTTEKE